MAIISQANLALERDAITAQIADQTALYASQVAKGQINSAQETLTSIQGLKKQEAELTYKINNYTQFSAERASQDAQIASTQNFETTTSPANQTVTSSTSTLTTSSTGGTTTTITAGTASLTGDAANSAKLANLKASAYTANPNGTFGNGTINRAVESGAITPEEAAALKAGSIPEADRFATASAARQSASSTVAAGTVETPGTTTVTPDPNSGTNTVVTRQVLGQPTTITSTSNLTNNTAIVTNPDGTKSEIQVNNTNATVTTTPLVPNSLNQSTETTITASQPIKNIEPANIDVNNLAAADGLITPDVQRTIASDAETAQVNALATADGLITPDVQRTIASDAVEAAQVNALAEADGLITPDVQRTIASDAETAQVNALAEADGLIIPSVQKTIASDAETAQVNALAVADGLITPSVQQQLNAIGVKKAETRSTATNQDSKSFQKAKDWRVRISLAPNSEYLYNAKSPGILAPLSGRSATGTTGTNGVIFPYTPNISVAYAASYDPTDIAHSNYKIFQYKNSSVDNISITGDFTAQDTNEANYMLAVIHFFRSVTKMFYGQDNNPKPGVPPPLCYLSGFGTYQFDNHPMVITNFTYTTPTDVDYIRAGSQTNMPGQSVAQQPSTVNTSSGTASAIRLSTSNLTPRLPNFQKQNSSINSDATYVPTKISIAITALPVVARNDISNRFSLEKYATGQLLQGSKNNGGGIW